MPQPSLILELQALAQAGSTDLGELLRRSKVVATKLQLADFAAWIECELNGYRDEAAIPEYRKVGSHLAMVNPYHGLQPVGWTNDGELPQHFASIDMRQSIGQIAHLMSDGDGHLQAEVTPTELEVLLKLSRDFGRLRSVRIINKSGVANLLDAVRNRILNWALDLEQRGVLGEGMTFSREEKQAAAAITINNYGPVGAVVGQAREGAVQQPQGSSTIATATNSPGAVVTAAAEASTVEQRIHTAIRQAAQTDADIATALKQIAEAVNASRELAEQQDEIREHLAFIAEQCAKPAEQRARPALIKATLLALRSTLGVVADVAQTWSTFGPAICTALKVSGL